MELADSLAVIDLLTSLSFPKSLLKQKQKQQKNMDLDIDESRQGSFTLAPIRPSPGTSRSASPADLQQLLRPWTNESPQVLQELFLRSLQSSETTPLSFVVVIDLLGHKESRRFVSHFVEQCSSLCFVDVVRPVTLSVQTVPGSGRLPAGTRQQNIYPNSVSEDEHARDKTLTLRNASNLRDREPNQTPDNTDEDSNPEQDGNSSGTSTMERKASSPMAPPFMVSAPGKVIVFGEHAVVHGKRAMAAAISLRSYLHVTTLSKSRRTITLNFRDIGLNHTWDIDSLPWDVFNHPSRKKFYYDLVTSLDPELLDAMKPHIEAVSQDKPEDIRKIHQSSATAFLYLFLSLSSPETHPAIYTMRSTIPIGAGLGSSASVCVCLSAALLTQIRVLSGPHRDQPPDEAEVQIERINRWAFVGEMCIHGNPSGVDNTVSSGGKAVLFQRGDYSKPPSVQPILDFPELPLLLVNSCQSRSTATEVAKVGALKKKLPAVTESILDGIDQVAKSAYEFITTEGFDKDSAEAVDHFGTLFRLNHGLLVSLGVSHPRLERIRELVDHTGIGWTKLTGAGGGGCAITLLTEEATPSSLQQLEESLATEGYERYKTTLGGDGVGVLMPAILKGAAGDETGGQEIDQQKLENAVGNDGIEKLVGLGGDGAREGWKFWRRTAM